MHRRREVIRLFDTSIDIRVVEAAIMDKREQMAAPGQCSKHVEAVGKHSDLARTKPLALQPFEHKLADLGFPAGGAFDIAKREGKLDQFLGVD